MFQEIDLLLYDIPSSFRVVSSTDNIYTTWEIKILPVILPKASEMQMQNHFFLVKIWYQESHSS